MNTISSKFIKEYLTENYGEPRHNVKAMAKAIRYVGNTYKLNKIDLFHLIVENQPMGMTHSYGFHTRYGRELIETFKQHYESNNKI